MTNRLLHITLVLFMLVPSLVSAQDTEEERPPGVTVETSSETPSAGVLWTLTILVNHGEPDEVTVIAPPFAPNFTLDRLVKNPRTAGERTQTVFEYRLLPNRQGRYTLESFTVITPHGITETSPLVLNVRSDADIKPSVLRIVWEGVPSQIAKGEQAVIALRAPGWNSKQPPTEFFMPEVPMGAILSLMPLSAQERESGMAAKLALIPLDRDFRLPARVLRYENFIFEIPALNIRAYSPPAEHPAARDETQEASSSSGNVQAQFPDFDPAVYDKSVMGRVWRGQCENIYNTAKDLWENGLYSQSLAELRRNEKHHPAGALLRQVRREAEELLMFFNTADESREQRNFLLGLSFLFFFLVIITPFVCFMIFRQSSRKKAALFCAVFFTALGFLCLYWLVDSRSVFGEKSGRFGITGVTPVRRAADFEGEELFSFREGQPVAVMLNSGGWVFVRTNDSSGAEGWIPADAVIIY
jgi:hypothetical protein